MNYNETFAAWYHKALRDVVFPKDAKLPTGIKMLIYHAYQAGAEEACVRMREVARDALKTAGGDAQETHRSRSLEDASYLLAPDGVKRYEE